MLKQVQQGSVGFKLDVESSIEESRFKSVFQKEPETLAWIDELFSSGDVFFDVGANIGVYTLYCAAKHEGVAVFSFEPAFHNYYKLCKNVILNDFENVHPICLAVGDSDTLVHISLSSLEEGSASHSVAGYDSQKKAEEKTFSHFVAQNSIDKMVERGEIPIPQHIKIDVDGFEKQVVAGMRHTLKNKNLHSILVELDHQLSDTDEILGLIEAESFSISHPLNTRREHSRLRREAQGTGHIENIIFTRK